MRRFMERRLKAEAVEVLNGRRRLESGQPRAVRS